MGLKFLSWDTPEEAKIRALGDALQPFADYYFGWMHDKPDSFVVHESGDGDHTETITVGDIRRARLALDNE